MHITVDSGGTKASWGYLINNDFCQVTTEGLHPNYNSHETLVAKIQAISDQLCPADAITFYGAGCGTKESREKIYKALQQCFPSAKIDVEEDMLGACRALCGHHAGLVGILGTGSNACLYDGNTITTRVASLGFVMGDEGSGAYIGKCMVKDFFAHRMPPETERDFALYSRLDEEVIIDILYRQEKANSRIAGLVPFAIRHRDEVYMQHLLAEAFDRFIYEMVLPLRGDVRNLWLVGGIAKQFEKEISEVAKKRGYFLCGVLGTPIEALVRYHSER